MVNGILTRLTYQIHHNIKIAELDFMKSTTEHRCPVCEFEKGNIGQPIPEAGGMVCLACGASWKTIGTSQTSVSHDQKAEYNLKSTSLVDNRVFNKRHFEEPRSSPSFDSETGQKNSFSNLALACFLLLLSAGLFLQSWVWLNPEKDELLLSEVKLEEQTSQNGSNVYTVRGVLYNGSSSIKPIPRISIVLRSAEGKPLVRWYHNSPVTSMTSNSEKRFASSIIHTTDNVAYVEASLQE